MLLKRLLVGVLTVVMGVSFAMAYHSADEAEHARMSTATTGLGLMFTIPVGPVLDDPDIVAPALEQAATRSGVNLFRTAVGWDEQDHPFVAHFILVTTQTAFYDVFRLRDGRWLTSQQTQDGASFMSTRSTGESTQVATLEDIGRNHQVWVRGFSTAFDSLPTAGTYALESHTQADMNRFFEILVGGLTEAGASLTGDDLSPDHGIHGEQKFSSEPWTWAMIWAGIIVVVVLVAFRQLYEAKRTAVLLLGGDSPLQAWFTVTGRMVISSLVALCVLSVAGAALVPGTTVALITTMGVHSGLVSLFTVVASSATVTYVAWMRIPQALKNRKDTQMLIISSVGIKCVLTSVLIGIAAVAVGHYAQMREAASRVDGWQQASGYAVLYPKSNGADGEELRSGGMGSTAAEVYDLYPVVNARGGLFIDASQYERVALAQPMPEGAYRSIRVNPNYLAAYPVVDTSGNPVTVHEAETAWVLLVPESYRHDQAKIMHFFQGHRTGDGSLLSAGDYERNVFGRETPTVQDQTVTIVWVANGQHAFSFDPEVYPDQGNHVESAIIEVMTMNNSTGLDRANAFGGSPGIGMKVKLTDANTTKTLEELRPVLASLHLDDNFRHLVTMNDYAASEVQRIQHLIRNTIIQGVVVFAMFLIFVIQSVTVLFENDARRVAVRKLIGYRFISRHRRFFTLYIAVWTAQLMIAPIIGIIGARLGRLSMDLLTILTVAGTLLLMETLISACALFLVETRRLANVLKGEF